MDLGDVTIGQSVQSDYKPIAAGETIWFRFRLTTGISPLVNWLDIDTAGPSGIVNTEVGLYDAQSNLINVDNDSGGSGNSAGNGWAAAVSFGGGSGEKLSGDAPGWGGGRLSDGAWGASLDAGVYWVAVVGWDADFSQNPNPNWQVSTLAVDSGAVRLRVATGPVPSTYWNERHHGPDCGSTPATAQVVTGTGPLATVMTSSGPLINDMFKIRICDGANFQVVATSTLNGGGGPYRNRLFLFDETGRGVLAINNTTANTVTTLSRPSGVAPLPEGNYFLAVTTYCGSYFAGAPGDGGPLDANNLAIWNFAGHNNASLMPNGPGAANPVISWARQSDCVNNSDAYTIRLSLTGACHVSCPVDLDGNGHQDLADFAEFQNCFEGP